MTPASLYGMVLGIPTRAAAGGGVAYLFDVTAFTQALSAEKLANPGSPFTFTADNPTGWTVAGESETDPEVSEVGANEGHGGSGTGAINLYSSVTANNPVISQSVLTSGRYYEILWEVSHVVAGQVRSSDNASGLLQQVGSAGVRTYIAKASGVVYRIFIVGSPGNITIAKASIRELTQNALQTAQADADIRAAFALPDTTIAGQTYSLTYRVPEAETDPFVNGWRFYLQRNAGNTAWDLRADSIVAGIPTNRLNVTGVGNPNAIRVVTEGDDHTFYTATDGIDSEAWTQRGGVVTNTTHNTGVKSNTMYSAGFTSLEHRAEA